MLVTPKIMAKQANPLPHFGETPKAEAKPSAETTGQSCSVNKSDGCGCKSCNCSPCKCGGNKTQTKTEDKANLCSKLLSKTKACIQKCIASTKKLFGLK